MKRESKHTYILYLCATMVTFVFNAKVLAAEPLKVFILAGQSNMQGAGELTDGTYGNLQYMYDTDPATFGHLKDAGGWVVRDDVWISYARTDTEILTGGLTVGFGAANDTIGPELQFGNVMGNYFGDQILLIKTAWGGKSLAIDFRSPSSGDINDELTYDPPKTTEEQGYYYREILSTVNDVLANLTTHFPAYNPADGYEIIGFGWHQGWNDRTNQNFNDQYERNMKNFIKDFRADIGISNLPFVIATTGMSGWDEVHHRAISLMEAQLAMEDFDKYPEFEGNVAVDDTRDYWIAFSESPVDSVNFAYHWNLNAKIYCNIGNGLATEMIDILIDPNAPTVDAGVDMITWSGQEVTLASTVVEKAGSDWTDLTYAWTADPDTGVLFSAADIESPTVTITKATDNPSPVTLTLAVNDTGRLDPPVQDTMTIDVYDDACKAAIGASLAADHSTDIDKNCITNIKDVALMAKTWLVDNALTVPVVK